MKCIVCDKSNFSIEIYKEELRQGYSGYDKCIVKCLNCKLMFIYPQWTQEELDELYKGYLDKKDFSWQKQIKRITKYLKKYLSSQDIALEIGCGKGDTVKWLRKKGIYVIGIDKDPTYCDEWIIYNKDYKDVKNKYTNVYAIQVFEHIADPEEFIKKIQDLLLEGGKFLLEFPNTEDPILTLYKVEKFKKFYYIPFHLFFWTPKTVKLFFDKLGIKIKIIRLQKYGILNHLRWIIFGVPGNWHPHIPILDNIYKFILTRIFKVSDTIIVIGKKN